MEKQKHTMAELKQWQSLSLSVKILMTYEVSNVKRNPSKIP